MPSKSLIVAILSAAFASEALATDLMREAVLNGYRLVPPVSARSGDASAASSEPVYVRLTEPRRRMSVLQTHPARPQPTSQVSVVNFEINCAKGALKYVSVQALDSPWNLRASHLPLPKTVWHMPINGSVPAQALAFVCAA